MLTFPKSFGICATICLTSPPINYLKLKFEHGAFAPCSFFAPAKKFEHSCEAAALKPCSKACTQKSPLCSGLLLRINSAKNQMNSGLTGRSP